MSGGKDALSEMIQIAAGAIMFCLGVIMLLSRISQVKELSTIAGTTEGGNDIMYVSVEESAEPVVTYEQLIASLMGGKLEYDVYVCGIELDHTTFTPGMLASYAIPKFPAYDKEIVYNTDGSIKLVKYTEI